jgi:hypothetical protein
LISFWAKIPRFFVKSGCECPVDTGINLECVGTASIETEIDIPRAL